jgi:hypothetical protein
VVKRDDVRRAGVPEELLIEPDYFRRGDQVKAEFRGFNL